VSVLKFCHVHVCLLIDVDSAKPLRRHSLTQCGKVKPFHVSRVKPAGYLLLHYRPCWIVTVAFFMAEMGDKTLLAKISLAVEYNTILPVRMGTTIGMIITNGFGIMVGM